MVGFAAHLRVYEPLRELSRSERAKWESYVAGDVPSRPMQMAREHEVAMAAVLRVPPRLDLAAEAGAGRAAVQGEQAYVRHVDGVTYICPWRLQLRAWDALDDFRAQLPDQLTEAFFPAGSTTAAEDARDAWVATHPDVRPGILSSTWQVPVSWFALFDPSERRLVLGQRQSGSNGTGRQAGMDRSLLYLTPMSDARKRMAKALHTVRKAFDEGPATASLEEVGRWLEEFHPHSLVELDYGGLVHLVDDETLSADQSAADVAESLGRLAAGDLDGAGRGYERIMSRWRAMAALEHAN